jgi:16S rRNA A1518/A1519 N6-dimethyltransferase RsmA/KsgA/DIM1 with predicted DNA glycosylase/AP lyase activity
MWARLLFDVARQLHAPPPVRGELLRLEPSAGPGVPEALIASTAFLTRRKTLLNGLTARYGREETRAAIAALGLLETVRAEELGLDVFRKLGGLLKPLSAAPD